MRYATITFLARGRTFLTSHTMFQISTTKRISLMQRHCVGLLSADQICVVVAAAGRAVTVTLRLAPNNACISGESSHADDLLFQVGKKALIDHMTLFPKR
ncbi:hypothetical protein QYE76_036127 [Lolium multiflorum]|uniref:Uncharacterized protein n=1 Tax=Lolium multiflorum TaxID=4521 RepID=A0AAD8VMU1_LOLMU|nr:hypothetical protein QYE76_036127 [Lolium multiflorum]